MGESNKVKIITKRDFDSFISNLIKEEVYETIGVKSKGEKYGEAAMHRKTP